MESLLFLISITSISQFLIELKKILKNIEKAKQ